MADPNPNLPLELTDPMVDLLAFLDRHGGKYQRRRDEFATELGVKRHHLERLTLRAEELHLILVERGGSPVIGEGRFPNTYVLKVELDWFLDNRERLSAERMARRRRGQIPASERRKLEKARRDRDRRRRIVEAIDEQVVVALDAAAPAEARVVDGIDVDAWGDFDDF